MIREPTHASSQAEWRDNRMEEMRAKWDADDAQAKIGRAFAVVGGCPTEYRDADVDDWAKDNQDLHAIGRRLLCLAQEGADVGAIISGPVGIGKTRLLIAIAIRLSQLGIQSSYVPIAQLLGRIKSTFTTGRRESQEDVLKSALAGRVLLIDEIGVGKMSEWTSNTLYLLLDQARSMRMQVIGATNLTRNGLKAYLSSDYDRDGRIFSRLIARSPVLTPKDCVDMRAAQSIQAMAAFASDDGASERRTAGKAADRETVF